MFTLRLNRTLIFRVHGIDVYQGAQILLGTAVQTESSIGSSANRPVLNTKRARTRNQTICCLRLTREVHNAF